MSDMDIQSVGQLKERLGQFIHLKGECETIIKEDYGQPDVGLNESQTNGSQSSSGEKLTPNGSKLLDNVQKMKFLLINIIKIFTKDLESRNSLPKELVDLLNISELTDSSAIFEDLMLKEEKVKPKRRKRREEKDEVTGFTFSDKDSAESWVQSTFDTPRNRYIVNHRAKHGPDALLLDEDSNDESEITKAIEYNVNGEDGKDGDVAKKKPHIRKPHLSDLERGDIYSFYMRYKDRYSIARISNFINQKYALKEHGFRSLIKQVEKKNTIQKGKPSGRARKLAPDVEAEMVEFMKSETRNGRLLKLKTVADKYSLSAATVHRYMETHHILRINSKTKRILRLQAEGKEYTPYPEKYSIRAKERARARRAGISLESDGRSKKGRKAKNSLNQPSIQQNEAMIAHNMDQLSQHSDLDQQPTLQQQHQQAAAAHAAAHAAAAAAAAATNQSYSNIAAAQQQRNLLPHLPLDVSITCQDNRQAAHAAAAGHVMDQNRSPIMRPNIYTNAFNPAQYPWINYGTGMDGN